MRYDQDLSKEKIILNFDRNLTTILKGKLEFIKLKMIIYYINK